MHTAFVSVKFVASQHEPATSRSGNEII